ncbi:hypothetical protein [Streptomyces sp. NPDC090445]|uniref:hypothetical protein n=1 Tax=Streptomyces sp. NPDC090445 TaxID=3365963 RepID=UPI00380BA107
MNGDALAVGLARKAVAEIAPDELILFEETSTAFLASRRAVTQRRRGREPLGMGVEIVGELLTGVALAVAVEVVRHAAVSAAGLVGARARPRLARWFRRRSSRRGSEPTPQPGGEAEAVPAVEGAHVEAEAETREVAAPEASDADVSTALPPLTADHLARLRGIALARALALGLPDDRAGLLADAIVGGLVSSTPAASSE